MEEDRNDNFGETDNKEGIKQGFGDVSIDEQFANAMIQHTLFLSVRQS